MTFNILVSCFKWGTIIADGGVANVSVSLTEHSINDRQEVSEIIQQVIGGTLLPPLPQTVPNVPILQRTPTLVDLQSEGSSGIFTSL